MQHDTLACAVYGQRETLLRRVATLPEAAWDQVCPAPAPPADVVRLDEPRRTVREVVAHLLLVDDLVLGAGALRAWSGMRRLEHPGGWDARRIAPIAELPVAELLTLLAQRGERFGRLVSGAPAVVRRLPVPGPFGRHPLAGVLGRRVLHEWLHEQDIAGTQPPHDIEMSASVAAVSTDAVLRLLPEAVLSRMALDAGVIRLVVELADERASGGSVQRSIWGLDFTRRQYGSRVLAPADATVRVSAPALAMLAYGRGDRLGEGPCVDVDGNDAMAGVFVAALGTPRAPAACLAITAEAVAS